MQPLGRRRWFVIVWTVAAAMMLASIIRVWTIPVDGANIGAGLIVIGIPGMILPGLLCLLAVESKWLLPKPSRTLQFVGLLLALATTFPSLHWIWQSYTTALPIPIFEGPLFLALGNPLWLLLSDILLLFLGPVSGAFYGEQLGDIVLWTFPAISALVLAVTGPMVVASRLRDGYFVTTVSAVTIWLILASRGLGSTWLVLIGMLLAVTARARVKVL